MTTQTIEEFRGHIKKSFADVLTDLANEKIQAIQFTLLVPKSESKETEEVPVTEDKQQILTTDEEMEGFYIVKSIV